VKVEVTSDRSTGRPNQKSRTRKDLLQATTRLLKQGRNPTLEEVAEEAMVSRATAYRYFPSADALLLEASLDVAVPEPADLFDEDSPRDPLLRLQQVEASLHGMIAANEIPLRLMLAQTLRQRATGEAGGELPVRQNRRTPLIEAALEPSKDQFRPADLKMLTKTLAIILGTESMVVLRDVLQLQESEAQKVRLWAIRALLQGAKKPDAR